MKTTLSAEKHSSVDSIAVSLFMNRVNFDGKPFFFIFQIFRKIMMSWCHEPGPSSLECLEEETRRKNAKM